MLIEIDQFHAINPTLIVTAYQLGNAIEGKSGALMVGGARLEFPISYNELLRLLSDNEKK
jgi:hypothetical protein